MPFTADLNPKTKGMDLGDLLKMDEAMAKRRLYQDALNAKPGKTTIVVPVKSSADDEGVPLKFGNSYQKD